jgi:hypothetical protein
MESNQRSIRITVVIYLISTALTAFSYFWTYRNERNNDKMPILENYPYIKNAIILTFITLLFGIIYSLLKKLEEQKKGGKPDIFEEMIIGYFFLIPIMLFVLHPGLDQLKIHSDGLFLESVIPICIIQCCSIYCFYYCESYKKIDFVLCLVLVFLSITVIFLYPYISAFLGGGGSSSYYEDYINT